MITSTKNKNVALIRSLNTKSKVRRSEGLFVADGLRLVLDIVKSGMNPKTIYMTENCYDIHKHEIDGICEVELVSEPVMKAMSDTDNPQGIIALFNFPEYTARDIFGVENPLVLILDEIRDPGNMGTIFRTFEAAGGSGIVLLGNCTDVLSPKCIRSTMGSIVRLPFIYSKNTEELKDYLTICPDLNIYAAHMDGKSLWEQNFCKPTAFVIGNEANGISDEGFKLAQKKVRIPMLGRVESLNAAVSAALLSFEAARQRSC